MAFSAGRRPGAISVEGAGLASGGRNETSDLQVGTNATGGFGRIKASQRLPAPDLSRAVDWAADQPFEAT